MGCCVCHTKIEDEIRIRKFSQQNKDYKFVLGNSLGYKIRKIEQFLKTEEYFRIILNEKNIYDLDSIKEILNKDDQIEKINKNFNSVDLFLEFFKYYDCKQYILNQMFFKEYDIISYIEKYLIQIKFDQEEKEKIENLIRLYLLLFKRYKEGLIYNIINERINLISSINKILINLTIFNKAELLNIKLNHKLLNNNLFFQELKELIFGMKNLSALIFQFESLDNIYDIYDIILFYQFFQKCKNLVYFIVIFPQYTEITNNFLQNIIDTISLDNLHAIYLSKIKIKLDEFIKLLNILTSLKKLKFFGIDIDNLELDHFHYISNCFLKTKSIYIAFFTAEKINIPNLENEIIFLKQKVNSNKTLSVIHIQEKFNFYIF